MEMLPKVWKATFRKNVNQMGLIMIKIREVAEKGFQ
jgi:hypothetical protein